MERGKLSSEIAVGDLYRRTLRLLTSQNRYLRGLLEAQKRQILAKSMGIESAVYIDPGEHPSILALPFMVVPDKKSIDMLQKILERYLPLCPESKLGWKIGVTTVG